MSIEANIPASRRLIVSLDLRYENFSTDLDVYTEVMRIVHILYQYRVMVKLHLAVGVCGYRIIEAVQNLCPVFYDPKFTDTGDTLKEYGKYLKECSPAVLTVMSTANIRAIKDILPSTKVLGVSIPTDMSVEKVRQIYGCSYKMALLRLATQALSNGADGLIASPFHIKSLRGEFGGVEIICPAIRPVWYKGGSSHVGTMTPQSAIRLGATGIVVGRPITEAKNIKVAVETILEEIESA